MQACSSTHINTNVVFFPLKHRRLLEAVGKLEDIGKSCRGKKSIFGSD